MDKPTISQNVIQHIRHYLATDDCYDIDQFCVDLGLDFQRFKDNKTVSGLITDIITYMDTYNAAHGHDTSAIAARWIAIITQDDKQDASHEGGSRTLDLDPDKIADAQAGHDFVQQKFDEARKATKAAHKPKFGPREAEALMRATTPTCKRCKVMHDFLRDGYCPGCYDEVNTF